MLFGEHCFIYHASKGGLMEGVRHLQRQYDAAMVNEPTSARLKGFLNELNITKSSRLLRKQMDRRLE